MSPNNTCMNWLILSPAKRQAKSTRCTLSPGLRGVPTWGQVVLLGNAVSAVENLLDEREYLPRCISCLLDSFFSLPLEKIRATSPTLECVQTTNQCRYLCQMRRIEILGYHSYARVPWSTSRSSSCFCMVSFFPCAVR